MSPQLEKSSNNSKKRRKKSVITEDYLIDFFKKYGISYTSNNDEIAINLALKGQEVLSSGNLLVAEKISSLLFDLSEQWKDGFIKMKSYLLKAEIADHKNEDKIPHLYKALSYAKKNNIQDVEVGVRIQIAYEDFKSRNYKSVLKELKIIEKKSKFFKDNELVVYELRSRVYWEIDDYIKGFDATYNWYSVLKKSSKDVYSLFVTIVYLLTVLSSTSLPHPKNRVDEIKNDIISLLNDLASSVHLFSSIIPFIDVLFAKSLMIVQPEILYGFADLVLQTSRWNDEEKYLVLCQKLADAFYNLDDNEKAIEIIDKALQYTKDKKYTKIEKILHYKKAEISSSIFYFMNFDSIFDPWMIEQVNIKIVDLEKKLFLDPLSSGVNTFPATSYSHLLRIIDKATIKSIVEDSLELVGLHSEEQRGFFVLDVQIAEDRVRLLVREDFNINTDITKTLHSTLTPYYSIIGLVTDEKVKKLKQIEGIEEILLRLQRTINCPAAKVTIYLSKVRPHLNLFKFYLQQGGFRDLQLKIIETAHSLSKEYTFARNEDFLQIFNADPITIFDLTLRNSEELAPLASLVNRAYGLKISNVRLSQFMQELAGLFLKRVDTGFWKDFYYEYAWLQTQGVFLSLTEEKVQEKNEVIGKILHFAKLLDNPSKILEGLYFKTYVSLVLNNTKLEENILSLKDKAREFNDNKYSIVSEILIQLSKTDDFNNNENIARILDNFCKLCVFRDWQLSLELFIYLLNKIPHLTTLFDICKEKDVKDAGIYLYLHLSKYLLDINRYSEALQLIIYVKKILEERKKNFFFSEHTWDYLAFLANEYLYDIFEELTKKEIKEHNLSKEQIIKDLLHKDEWISDPVHLVDLIITYTNSLLDKSEFSMGEKYYHWIEQLMFYFWDLFTSRSNQSLLKEINELKKRIESQHFI